MQPQNPAGDDARDLIEAILPSHARWFSGVKAQRHRTLPSELLTVAVGGAAFVAGDRSPAVNRRRLLDTYATSRRSRARIAREQPWGTFH